MIGPSESCGRSPALSESRTYAPLSKRTLLSQLWAAPSVAFVQKLRTIPNDGAVFRKDERITEPGIKSQPADFFDGGFVVGVTVTTQ